MKYINIPIYMNRFILGVTSILYLTIFWGLYAQIVLGAFQLITAFILLLFWKCFSQKQKTRLIIYWSIVLLYSLLWLIDWFHSIKNSIWIISHYILIPLSIAIYFTVILESLKIKKL